MKLLHTSLVSLLVLATLAAPAAADSATNDAVTRMLEQRLDRRGLDTVEVQMTGSTAILSGTVDTLRDRAEAARVAGNIEEIETVDNRLTLNETDRTHADVAADVSRALSNPTWNGVFDWVEAEIQGRNVRLHGAVTMPWKERSATRAMESIEGVREVTSDLEVLQVSVFDDELRWRAYEAIYGDLAFSQYAGMLEPPIHIVVDQGEVRLEGTVRNQAEKMLARSLVSRSTLPFEIENNLETSMSRES